MPRLAVVTCDYDTAFAPVAAQLRTKVEQLQDLDAMVSLWVAGAQGAFLEAVEAVRAELGDAPKVPIHPVLVPAGTAKGAALRTAVGAAAAADPDLFAYVNLNLKVDARSLGPALETLEDPTVAAVVGTRDAREGGGHHGQGALGHLKTRGFNRLVRRMFPSLEGFRDTNAPMKVFRPGAAQAIRTRARVEGLAFDCEWLLLFQRQPGRLVRQPIEWRQRAGSRPPYGQLRIVLEDLRRTRATLDAGGYD